jgi:sigma-B regulation protein RsbU (phosphoserine phosphatase)
VGQTGYLFLLDHEGLLLFSGGELRVHAEEGRLRGENYRESPDPAIRGLAQRMTSHEEGMEELVLEGNLVYAAYAPITPLGWSLGAAIAVEEIRAPALWIGEEIRRLTGETRSALDGYMLLLAGQIVCLLLAVLLGAAVAAVPFTSSFTRPILALHEGVREVSGGNLDKEVRINTGDELEDLAVSFNAMTARLRELVSETARVTAEKERIATELDVATRIQAGMLPYAFPPFPDRENNFDLYAAVYPAREVGGDFFDFFYIDEDHFVILAADVSGKGVPAALFMAITRTLIKNRLQAGGPLEQALEQVNRQLCDTNSEGMFVTLWLGVLEISSGLLDYINAGHNPPLIRSAGRGFAYLKSPPDLFLAGDVSTSYHRRELSLQKGDALFLYTDGVTEASNREGKFFGKDRLRAFLDVREKLPARELIRALRGELEHFSRGLEQSDDVTMLVLKITGEIAKRIRPPEALELPAETVAMCIPVADGDLPGRRQGR